MKYFLINTFSISHPTFSICFPYFSSQSMHQCSSLQILCKVNRAKKHFHKLEIQKGLRAPVNLTRVAAPPRTTTLLTIPGLP